MYAGPLGTQPFTAGATYNFRSGHRSPRPAHPEPEAAKLSAAPAAPAQAAPAPALRGAAGHRESIADLLAAPSFLQASAQRAEAEAAAAADRPLGTVMPVDIFKDQSPTQDYATNTNMAMAGNANAYMNNAQPAYDLTNELGEHLAGPTPTASPSPQFFHGVYEARQPAYN